MVPVLNIRDGLQECGAFEILRHDSEYVVRLAHRDYRSATKPCRAAKAQFTRLVSESQVAFVTAEPLDGPGKQTSTRQREFEAGLEVRPTKGSAHIS
jgi:hypothetical protein